MLHITLVGLHGQVSSAQYDVPWRIILGRKPSILGTTDVSMVTKLLLHTQSIWLLCMITSDQQISPPSLVCEQTSSHFHSLGGEYSLQLFCLGNSFMRNLAAFQLQNEAWWWNSDENIHKAGHSASALRLRTSYSVKLTFFVTCNFPCVKDAWNYKHGNVHFSSHFFSEPECKPIIGQSPFD